MNRTSRQSSTTLVRAASLILLAATILATLGLAHPGVAAASLGDIYAEGTYYRATTYSGHYGAIGTPLDLNVRTASGSWVDDHRWPLYAPASGSVAVNSLDNGLGTGWGNSIIWVSLDGSERMLIAHLDDFGKIGPVESGDFIGYVGSTGRSTGDHVHIERSVDDAWSTVQLSGVNLAAGGLYRSGGPLPLVPIERLASDDRFSTAVQIAREGFANGGSDWSGVTDIVIASGDDRAAADPLAAAGLCWAYDAPLFLVSESFTPASVRIAVKEIVADNPGAMINVHIVGGPVSVPDARYDDIARTAGVSSLAQDRLLATGSRFDLAATIAREMERVSGTTPDTVLVANGADAEKFFDALALSPIAARRGFPILLVNETSIPAATNAVLGEIKPSGVIVGGGPATVSESVRSSLKATRWSAGDRYSTATTIASRAISAGYLDPQVVGVAAKLPDALTGGSMIGRMGGPLVITNGASLSSPTGAWLSHKRAGIDHCYLFGGEKSLTWGVKKQIKSKLN